MNARRRIIRKPFYISEPSLAHCDSFVSFNFEQSGPDFFACKVAFVIVENCHIVKEKEYLIQPPGNEFHSFFSLAHGVSPDITKHMWAFDKLWPILRSYLRGKFVIAHTLRSELEILRKSLQHYGLSGVQVRNTLCTAELYSNNTIYNIASVLNLETDDCSKTLLEARLCALAYIRYLQDGDIHPLLRCKMRL